MEKLKKILVLFLMFGMVFNFNIKMALAGGWWFESIASEIMHETWWELRENLEGTMLAELKRQGIETLYKDLETASEDYFIDNFKSYLGEEVKEETSTFMEKHFNTIESNAITYGGAKAGGYAQKMIRNTRDVTTSVVYGKDDENYPEIENYVKSGDVEGDLFNEDKQGGIEMFPVLLEDRNNVYGLTLNSIEKASQTKELIKEAKIVETTSTGYKAGEGKAASTYEKMASESEMLKVSTSKDLIVNAKNMAELAAILGRENTFNGMAIIGQAYKEGAKFLKDGIKTAAKGMYQGAIIGSVLPGIGTGIGSVIGLVKSVKEMKFTSSKSKNK